MEETKRESERHELTRVHLNHCVVARSVHGSASIRVEGFTLQCRISALLFSVKEPIRDLGAAAALDVGSGSI